MRLRTFSCCTTPKPSSCSRILPTTFRSTVTYAVWAGSGTLTLSVVHHAYQAERLDVSFFVLGDDDDDKQADEYTPTQVGQALGRGSMETKCEASLI
jgi:hypothetical protein